MICTTGAGALNATYEVTGGGASYSATIEVEGEGRYSFWETGPLGERIPRPFANVTLRGACGNCSFDWADPFIMNFTAGTYTLRFDAPIHDNQLQGTFGKPYNVTVRLPPGLDVRNPLLGSLTNGAGVAAGEGGSLAITWNMTRSFGLRFYDSGREQLLLLFGAFWLTGLALVLVPYLLGRRREGSP